MQHCHGFVVRLYGASAERTLQSAESLHIGIAHGCIFAYLFFHFAYDASDALLRSRGFPSGRPASAVQHVEAVGSGIGQLAPEEE